MLISKPNIDIVLPMQKQVLESTKDLLSDVRKINIKESILSEKSEKLERLLRQNLDLIDRSKNDEASVESTPFVFSVVLNPFVFLSCGLLKRDCFYKFCHHTSSLSDKTFDSLSIIRRVHQIRHVGGYDLVFTKEEIRQLLINIVTENNINVTADVVTRSLNQILDRISAVVRLQDPEFVMNSDIMSFDETSILCAISHSILILTNLRNTSRLDEAPYRVYMIILKSLIAKIYSKSSRHYFNLGGALLFNIKLIEYLTLVKSNIISYFSTNEGNQGNNRIDLPTIENNIFVSDCFECNGCKSLCKRKIISCVSSNQIFTDFMYKSTYEEMSLANICSTSVMEIVTSGIWPTDLSKNVFNIISGALLSMSSFRMPILSAPSLSHFSVKSLVQGHPSKENAEKVLCKYKEFIFSDVSEGFINARIFIQNFVSLEQYYFKSNEVDEKKLNSILEKLDKICSRSKVMVLTRVGILELLRSIISQCKSISTSHFLLSAAFRVNKSLKKPKTDEGVHVSGCIMAMICSSVFKDKISDLQSLKEGFCSLIERMYSVYGHDSPSSSPGSSS